MKILKRSLLMLILLSVGVWANNTSLFATLPKDQKPRLLAHRGLHQIYAGTARTSETCRVNPIHPPTHKYIENTIASMRAAFAKRADVVELDVHLTTDNVFAVFHDWRLECQTNGFGVTEEQDFAYLKTLDIGFGFSLDGQTFPFRGTGIGQMPSLTEVLAANLKGQYLINFKSNRAEEGVHFAKLIEDNSEQIFGVYGGEPPTQAALRGRPDLRGFDKASLKACLLNYMLVGWSGSVPQVCKGRIIAVPMDYGPFLWGWPHKFTQRMKAVGTDVILWGPYDGSGFSSGIDDAQTFAKVPKQFDGYLWTNRAELISPLMTR